MAMSPLAGAGQFNFALQALRQSLQEQQVAAAVLSQAQQAPSQVGLEAEAGGSAPVSPDSPRGTLIDILA